PLPPATAPGGRLTRYESSPSAVGSIFLRCSLAGSAEAAQLPEVDPLVVGVNVEPVAAQESHERDAQPIRGLDREVRRSGHRGDDRDTGDGRLLDDLEADAGADP